MEESYYANGGGSLRTKRASAEVDPMSSVANLSDAMLVFACGLLIALVVAWNVDLGNVTQVEIDQSQQIEDIETMEGLLDGAGTGYVQRGTVYEDPNTGTLYLLEDASESGSESASQSGSTASAKADQ